MAPPESPSDIESRWYRALFEEDCVEVMHLLKNDRNLLSVGLGPEPSRMVTGCRGNFWVDETTSEWKGRTALHVAARRGCATLVKQVIILILGGGSHDKLDDKSRRWNEEVEQVLSQRELLIKLSEEGSKLICDGEGSQRFIRVIMPSKRSSSTTTLSPEPSDLGKNERDRSRTKMSGSHEELLRASEGDRREVPMNVKDTASGSSQDDVQFVSEGSPTEVDRNSKDRGSTSSRDDELVSDGDSKICRFNLYEVNNPFKYLVDLRDGEYKLDAFAMAYLHPNLDVLSLFNFMTREGFLYRAKVMQEMEFYDKVDESSLILRARLRKTTENWGMQNSDCLRFLSTNYVNHRDFNFLPWGEYLFHCLHVNRLADSLSTIDSCQEGAVLARSLLEAVCRERGEDSSSDSTRPLSKFLLQLQDGQGRTPFNVAVDEGTVKYKTVYSLPGHECSDGEMITVSDVSGMTAWYRAAALGTGAAFREIMTEVYGFKWNLDEENVTLRSVDIESIVAKLGRISRQNGFKGRRIIEGKFVENAPIYSMIILHSARTLDRICSGESIGSYREASVADDFDDNSENGSKNDSENNLENDSEDDSERDSERDSENDWKGNDEFMRSFLNPKSRFTCRFNKRPCALNPLDLATLLGDLIKVKQLLRLCGHVFPEEWTYEDNRQQSTKFASGPQAIHFAAHHGSYEMLKEILDNSMAACDPYAQDQDGNTALHYAMKMLPVKFEAHLYDYVSCEHLKKYDLREREEIVYPGFVGRQGCINRLLQSGCDIFKANKDGQIPYPSGDLSTNTVFLQWWYEKQSKEFGEIQNTMSFAANAISVTATLVATASYVGPLQPPLGYGDDDQMQAKNLWVKAFIVCDTLSFYLAIASITFSLIPSLPMPQQPMREELRRKRVMVIVATAILFPSIICILVAFASSSIAVTTANGPSSTGGSLTVVTSVTGTLICLVGFLLFSIRLLKFVYPRSKWIRTMYNLTSF